MGRRSPSLLGAFWKPPGPETCPPWAYFQPQTFTQPAISDHEARRPVGREGAKKDEIEKRFPARVRALHERTSGFPDSRIPGFPPRTARGSGPSRDSFNVNERFREARTFCMGARARLRACTSALCGARVTCARLRLCGARIGHVIIADRICRYSSFR